ncbi:hypothetical protein MUK42_28890 [Musa troglodytarum]|uniref:Uncharacterized protein n=1 Tax=Musa troglodytarum TaxID=320322 RepID=A0A9E7JYJ5_9LILI|nr:hypothetical protein MUK42_28890 [Musa troglodytarum]
MWLTKVGLQAGRYSGRRRPDLNLTPQALQRVLVPRGPARHCGVFWAPQWLHRRSQEPEAAVACGFGFRPRFFGRWFLAGGGVASYRRKLWSAPAAGWRSYTRQEMEVFLEEEREDEAEEEVALVVIEEESAKTRGPDTDHAAAERQRLLRLAFMGTITSLENPQTAGLLGDAPWAAATAGVPVWP